MKTLCDDDLYILNEIQETIDDFNVFGLSKIICQYHFDLENCKQINSDKYNGKINFLRGAPIKDIYMYSFNGDLSPLKGSPIQLISMYSFLDSVCNFEPYVVE